MIIYKCDRCGQIMSFADRSTMQIGECVTPVEKGQLKEKNDLCLECYTEFVNWYNGGTEDGED